KNKSKKNPTRNSKLLPFSLSTELPKIKGDHITWPTEARLHFNKIRQKKLPSGAWTEITNFYNKKFNKNIQMKVLAAQASCKRSENYLKNPEYMKPKKIKKTIALGIWETKVKVVVNRIYTDRQNLPIPNSCNSKQFPASSANFNTIDLTNREIGRLGPEAINSMTKIANVLQTAQICYQDLSEIKRQMATLKKTKLTNITKSDKEKIEKFKRIESNLMILIASGSLLNLDDIPNKYIETYWFLARNTPNVNNANARKEALYRCREFIITLSSRCALSRRLFSKDNFIFETNQMKFYRNLKEKIKLGTHKINLSHKTELDNKSLGHTQPPSLSDNESIKMTEFWDSMWKASDYQENSSQENSSFDKPNEPTDNISNLSNPNPTSTSLTSTAVTEDNNTANPSSSNLDLNMFATFNEFAILIKNLPNWKAPGPDGIFYFFCEEVRKHS
ncbi:MAG: hypothetical protein MHPSP_002452, partial [Paramarteilia canceri]